MDQEQHLTDDALLLLAEAERDIAAASSARAHLDTCSACRMRLAHLLVLEAGVGVSPADDGWAGDARRARRRAQLLQAMRDAAAPPIFVTVLQRAPVISGSLAAVALLAVVLWASSGGATRAGGSRERLAARPDASPVHTLPIRAITPGATVALATEDLCRRMPWEPPPVPETVRDAILRAYGMERVPDHEYELDYLITPDLGGSPDPRNLWPEPYRSPVWNARVKDELESLLPRLVCEGKVDLRTAQREIAVDWIAAYKKYFKTDRPLRPYATSPAT